MNTSVVEPLHNMIDHLPRPSMSTPSMRMPHVQLPAAVTDHLPDRFRPDEPSRSRRPLLVAVLVVVAAVAIRMVWQRRRSSGDGPSYNGSTATSVSDAPFVDVR